MHIIWNKMPIFALGNRREEPAVKLRSMKNYRIEFLQGEELVTEKKGAFTTRKSAENVAAAYAEQLERGRDGTVTYRLYEEAPTDADGNLTDQPRQKRQGNKRGERTQRMFNFRLDNDLRPLLDAQPNKGRFLNELIRRALKGGDFNWEERPEEFNDRFDRRP